MKLSILLIFALAVQSLASQDFLGGYDLVDPSEVDNDATIQDLLYFGADEFIQKEIQSQALPDSKYRVTGINSVFRQVVSGLNYQFDVQLSNLQGLILRASYIIYTRPWDNIRELSSYSYMIDDNFPNEDMRDPPIGEFDFSSEHIIGPDDESFLENLNSNALPGGYQELDVSQAQNDPEISETLNYGVQSIIEDQRNIGGYLNEAYTVAEVYSIASQVVSGRNLRFFVRLENPAGDTVKLTFIVYQSWDGTRQLSSYTYYAPSISDLSGFEPVKEGFPIGGYSPIDVSLANTDEQIRDALNFGVKYVTDQAVLSHTLPVSNYKVEQINSLYGQVVSGMNYRFDVNLKNCAGLGVRVIMVVYSQVWRNILQVSASKFDLINIPPEGLLGGNCQEFIEFGNGEETLMLTQNEEEILMLTQNEEEILMLTHNEEEELERLFSGNVFDNNEGLLMLTNGEDEEIETFSGGEKAGGYTPLDLSQVANDPKIQEIMNFGAQYVVDQGVQIHRLPKSSYSVSEVFGAEKQIVSGENYRFDVELKNCQGLTLRATYVVYNEEWSNTREVSSYSFDITAAPNGLFIDGCSNEIATGPTIEGPAPVPVLPQMPLLGGFSLLDPAVADSDPDVKNTLDYGIDQVIQDATQIGTLPNEKFHLTTVNSVERQVVRGFNYRFDVTLTSDSGQVARVSLIVNSVPFEGTMELLSYSFIDQDQ